MLAAAGIVVTEIRTPTSAPDLAEVRDRTPAVPASAATIAVKWSGREMKSVKGCPSCEKSSGINPVASNMRVARKLAAIARGNPTASAVSDRFTRSPRLWTTATQRPANGPNSGPTTIAPMIRMIWSVRIPTAAISVATTMKARKLPESSTFSEVRDSTSSQTTASVGRPRAAFSAWTAAAEICESMSSSEIDPSRSISSSRRSEIITLASSRATSTRITSPSGRCAARSRKMRLQSRRCVLEQVERVLRLVARDDDPQVNHSQEPNRIPCGRC